MTPQEVITRFMSELNSNTYMNDTSGVGALILDDAVRASSKFTGTQDVIDQMLDDQIEAEKLAVEEVLGSDYAGKTMSQVPSSILNTTASSYNDTHKLSTYYIGDGYIYSMSVQDVIKERKAYIFLEQFCGIELNSDYAVINSAVGAVRDGDNVDTGAITGSDANLTLKVGDVVNGSTLTANDLSSLKTKYGNNATLSGSTIVIGSGVEKTETSIVPEEGDMYLFSASGTAKTINTGKNGWVVNATTGNDTITSAGRDSINAGAGSDKIIVNADEATVTTGNGNDTVEISASVKSVTITDLNASDTIKINGTFKVGSAQIENSTLVVTDKTGTRKIRFSDLTNVGNASIGAQTISDWLSDSGFSLSDLASGDIASGDIASGDIASDDVSGDVFDDAGRVTIDPDYKPNIDIANEAVTPQTQTISSAATINLDDVTITSGTVKAGSTNVGTVSTVTPAVMNFTTRGLTVHVGDGTASSYNALTPAQKMMVAALFKWWAGSCLELNEDSYDLGFTSDTAKVTDITLSFENLGGSTLALVNSQYRGGDGQVSQLQLKINTSFYNSYTEGDTNGISSATTAFLDRTLAHEFTHAVMSTNINNFSTLPQFIKEGMAELTHGIDDERGSTIFSLAYDASSLKSALNVNDTSTGTEICYAGGFMFLRYFARQAALQTLTDNFAPGDITATVNLGNGNATYYVSGNSSLETATTSKQNVSVGSSSGSTYTVGNTGVNQMISVSSGAKNIVGVNHKTSVKSGAGNDTIQFVEGTSIDAGDGNNSIVGSGQFAEITAGKGNDSVLVNGSTNSIALGDGNNLASIGSSTTYDNTITAGSGKDTVIANMNYGSQINLGDGDNVISVAARNSTIQTGDGNDSLALIYSNDSGNVISLGAGNDTAGYVSSNNTIDMGAGDDSVGSSSGNNVFLYNAESGNDTIGYFRSNDTLVIAGDYSIDTKYVYSNGYADFVVSLIKDSSVVGTINLSGASSDFNSLKNIVTVDPADTTPSDENQLLISLTADADTYSNTLDNATILALEGNDSITNSGDSVSIDGGDGDDTITNYGANTTINAGTGNNTVNNEGSNVIIDGSDGKTNMWNRGSSVTIIGGAGNSGVFNWSEGTDASINMGAGDNYIGNEATGVTIDAGAGDDTVNNSGANVTIDGGTGNDSISLSSAAENNLIQYTSGDGDDTVEGFNATSTLQIGGGTGTYSTAKSGDDIIVTVGDGSILLVGAASLASVNISGKDETPDTTPVDTTPSGIFTEGDDTYANTVDNVQLLALGGNDAITNKGSNVYINGMGGNDSIHNLLADNVSIDGGTGDDYIRNGDLYTPGLHGDSVTIDGGEGNDRILNTGANVSINGGTGDNYIYSTSNDVTILALDGNDDIPNFGDNVTIDAGAGNDRIQNTGTNVMMNGGSGDDSLGSHNHNGSKVTILGGAGNDSIFNVASYSTIDGGDDNDTIDNSSDHVTINGGAGDDSIYNGGSIVYGDGNTLTNTGNNTTILGGDGNDRIDNRSSSVLLDGGSGDDQIQNAGENGSNVTINGGSGNDTISNSSNFVTISGGAGDDSIRLYYATENNLIQYTDGDGKDTVWGFNETSTLSISGEYSTQESGNDILVTVGDGFVLLVDAASLTSVNIVGKDEIPDTAPPATPVTGIFTEGDDTYSNTVDNVQLLALGGNDKITNRGSNVLIDGMGGNDSINNYSSKVTISGGVGADSLYNAYNAKNVMISGGDDNDTIDNRSKNTSISGGSGNDSIENQGSNVTIRGDDGADYLGNQGNRTIVDAGTGNDTVKNLNAVEDSINAGSGNDYILLHGTSYSTIDGGDGNDTIENVYGSNYNRYNGGGGDDYISTDNNTGTSSWGGDSNTINGGHGNDTIYIGTSSTLTAVGTIVEYADGDGDDVIDARNGNSYKIKLTSGTLNETLKSGSNIILKIGTGSITLKDAAGSYNLSVSGNIINVDSKYATEKETVVSATKATLISDASRRTHMLINGSPYDDKLYNNNDENTINGGDGNDQIYVSAHRSQINGGDGDDSIWSNFGYMQNTLDGGAGNDSIENYGNEDLILGGDGNDTIINSGVDVTIAGGKGDDSIELHFGSGYGALDNVIQYTEGDGNDTVWGFSATTTLSISGEYSAETVGKDILVTVGDGSILLKNAASLSAVNISGVEEPVTEYEFSWTFANGTATYTKTNGTSTETLFTISGLNSSLTADDLSKAITVSDDGKITLSESALSQKNITLTTSGDYSLALGEDCPTVTTLENSWTLDDTTATYHGAGKSEGYTLKNSKSVTYSEATEGDPLLTVTGVKDDLEVVDGKIDGLTVNGKVLTVTPDVVGENLSFSGGYKVVFDTGDYNGATFTGTDGKDTIEVNGSGLQIDGGKGNDTITSKGGNTYLFSANGGKDVVVGFDNDTIKVTDDSKVGTSVKGGDVIITVDKASMTLKNAATGKQVTVVDANDNELVDAEFYSDKIVKDNGATLTSAFKAKTFAADVTINAVDGSDTSAKFTLTGGDEDNTLTGSKGANFINGGGGDNILTGGKGNDTFAVGNGNDTITDYETSDKISLTADVKDFATDGDDVILSFGDDSLTIQDGVNKKITFIQKGKSSTEIFNEGGKTNAAGTSITLAASTESYTASAKMLTIDGGLTSDVLIIGNAKANKIFGGDGDDTLFGGKGNDTLTGGDGSDIFIFESGKDTITDYVSGEDKISLAASPTSESVTGKGDVVLKFGTNSLTIKKVAGQEITFADDTTKIYYNESIVGSDGATLQSSFKASTFTATDDLPAVDASAVTKKFTLTGGDGDNTLIGGKGNNLLNGGDGNDLLIGNAGADTFVSSSGNDTVGDYETKDRISLASAMTDYEIDDGDVIINCGDGSLTITDGAGKSITFVETTAKGKVTTQVNVFAADGIFNSKTTAATAATIKADSSGFDAGKYAKLVTIDGGLVEDSISILGNTKNNKIYAGDNGATLNGGKGSDTLWGGKGSDTFIYESGGGKDVIYGFGDDDILQLGGSFTASVKNNSIAFKVDTQASAVTLKDFTATSFNINGDTYEISGKTLVKG